MIKKIILISIFTLLITSNRIYAYAEDQINSKTQKIYPLNTINYNLNNYPIKKHTLEQGKDQTLDVIEKIVKKYKKSQKK